MVVPVLLTLNAQGSGTLTVPKSEMSDQAYAEFVAGRFDEAARHHVPIVFTNRGTMHARTVLNQIVSRSRRSLSIFSGQLSISAYDPIEMKIAARRVATRIRILLADSPPYSSDSALHNLQPEIDGGLILLRKFRPVAERANVVGLVKHFAIGDDRYIRFEDDAVERTATVLLNAESVNSGSLVDSVNKNFDAMWEMCPPVAYHEL